MKTVILCSPTLPKPVTTALTEVTGYQCTCIPSCASLPTPTASHPDMLFFNPPETEEAITEAAYYAANPRFFSQFASPLLHLEEQSLQSQYPFDILFDALGMGSTLYCKSQYTSSKVKMGFRRIVDVRQGYAACSTLRLSDRAAITADPSISRALTADGIRVLTVSPGGILLPGYDSGFIGGASAVARGTVFFFGDLANHPDHIMIRDFCRSEGFKITDFPDIPLTDHGGIRYIRFGQTD